MISVEPEFFSGNDKITKWYKNNSPSNVRIRRRHNIVLRLPGEKRIARQSWIAVSYSFLIDMDIVECINKYFAQIIKTIRMRVILRKKK